MSTLVVRWIDGSEERYKADLIKYVEGEGVIQIINTKDNSGIRAPGMPGSLVASIPFTRNVRYWIWEK